MIQLSFIFLMNGFGVWIYFYSKKRFFYITIKVLNDSEGKFVRAVSGVVKCCDEFLGEILKTFNCWRKKN